MSVKQSTKDLLSLFLGLGFLGSTLGALLSWNNAHARAGESLSELPLPSCILPNLTLSPVYGIGFWLFVLLILILGVYLGNRKLRQTAVLSLLQGDDNRAKMKTILQEEALNQALPLLITNFTSEELGLDLGDIVRYELSDLRGWANFRIIGITGDFGWFFGRTLPDGTEIDAEPSITNLSALKHLYTKLPNYMEASFFVDPEKNHQLNELKTVLYSQNPNFFQMLRFWDEELLVVVEPMERNLSLMERLYPVTMIISAVIGGVLCLLLVLNQAKETALLRMLGVEKGKIRAMLVKQILFLTLIGLLLGFILLIALRVFGAAQPSVAVAALVYLVGALSGALLGTIQVSKKKPMELLQVKE